jgi:hypothetical protein
MANEFIARRGLIVLTNGAKITGSLEVNGQISASGGISGSFSGDGSNITGIASSLTISGSTGSDVVNLKTEALNFTGSNGVVATVTNNTVTFSIPGGAVSGSSQIDHNATTNYVANQHIDHTAVSISAGDGLTGGGDISTTRTLTLDTGSTHFTGGVRTKVTGSNTTGSAGITLNYNQTTGNISASLLNSSVTVNGQSISLGGSGTVTANTTNALTLGDGLTGTSFNGGTPVTTTVDTGSTHFTGGVTTAINAKGVFSSSAQVAHNSTTGYVANEHINHTSVSITAGNGISGGGDISTTRTITLDTGSTHFTGGVLTRINAAGVYSSSAQVSYTGLSNIPAGIVSNSTQVAALLPNGTVSASSQIVASQITGIGAYATTGSNTFIGIQTIGNDTQSTNFTNGALVVSGGVGIAKNLNVSGNVNISGLLTVVSMSTQYVTSSEYTVGTSRIILNDDDNVRFAGLSITDSGSTSATGSLLWDSLRNRFIYDTNEASGGGLEHSAVLIAGPESYSGLGNEIELVIGRIPVATNGHTLDNTIASSSIRMDFPTKLTHVEAGLYVTGSISSSVGFSGNGSGLTNVSASSVAFNNITGKPTLVSASSQIDHNVTTNYVANQHIDHTTVSISAGDGLTGGGDISATRTLTLDTGSAHFTGGVTTRLNALAVFSSSAQVQLSGITGTTFGNNNYTFPLDLTIGQALRITGSAIINNVLYTSAVNLDVDTGTEAIATVAIASYDAAFFDYVVKKGTNYRAGTVMAVWDGTNIEFTDTSTNDLGNTAEVVFTVDILSGNARLLATVSSLDWIVKTAVRAL